MVQEKPKGGKIARIAGMRVYRGSVGDAVSLLSDALSYGRKAQVVFAYSYSAVLYSKDDEFRAAVDSAELVLADGKPLIWISKLVGKPITEKASGSDFMMAFAQECAKKKYGIFLLGARPETLARLEDVLEKRFLGLNVAGSYSPPFGEWTMQEEEKIFSAVNKSGANILFVGMSTPRQDVWLHKNRDKLAVNVSLGFGAAFDYNSGVKKRAPRWMQDAGLEWFYRLAMEPRRTWRRYVLGGVLFAWLVLKDLLKHALSWGI